MVHTWAFGIIVAALFVAVILAWFTAAWALDRHGLRPLPDGTWDAIVVPGCAVGPGGRPSAPLERRTRHAVALFREGRAPRIIFTGAIGTNPPAEAEVAADLARTLGIEDAALLIENRSTSTWENAQFAARLEHEGCAIDHWRVLVASDGYHTWRCERLFSRHFDQARGVGTQPNTRARIRGALREVFSIIKMALRPKNPR